MYKILGSDGKEYGPVTAEAVRQWIAEGRADGRTHVCAENTQAWRQLSDFPEFAPSLKPPPILPTSDSPPPLPKSSAAGERRTSGLAVASLVLGILGFCGITAIIGLVLGIVAQVKIKRSDGRLQGGGLAIAGICVSAFMLLFSIPLMAALLLPALAKAKQKSSVGQCQDRVKNIALAIQLYADEHDGKYPPAATWSDFIVGYLPGEENLQCTELKGEKCAYGFNRAVADKPMQSIPPETVVIFEASGGCNYFGGPDAITASPPHGRQYLIGFADGTVRQVREEKVSELRWEP